MSEGRHTLSSLEPSRNTVKVESMVTNTPSHGTVYKRYQGPRLVPMRM